MIMQIGVNDPNEKPLPADPAVKYEWEGCAPYVFGALMILMVGILLSRCGL